VPFTVTLPTTFPLPPKVAVEATCTAPVPIEPLMNKTPLLMVVWPVKVLEAVKVNAPLPNFIKLPLPMMTLLTVVEKMEVSIAPPLVPVPVEINVLVDVPEVSCGMLADKASVPPLVRMIVALVRLAAVLLAKPCEVMNVPPEMMSRAKPVLMPAGLMPILPDPV